MTVKRHLLFLLAFSFLFPASPAFAGKDPEIINYDAKLLEGGVSIHLTWQSTDPVILAEGRAGTQETEVAIDEFDNLRNRDGYSGETTFLLKLASPYSSRGETVSYVFQITDRLKRKSRQVSGEIEPQAKGNTKEAKDSFGEDILNENEKQKSSAIRLNKEGVVGKVVDKTLEAVGNHDYPPSMNPVRITLDIGNRVSFTVKASDDNGLDRIVVKILNRDGGLIDEQTFTQIGKTWEGTTRVFHLKRGSYTVSAQAFDGGGNSSGERRSNFTLGEKYGHEDLNGEEPPKPEHEKEIKPESPKEEEESNHSRDENEGLKQEPEHQKQELKEDIEKELENQKRKDAGKKDFERGKE